MSRNVETKPIIVDQQLSSKLYTEDLKRMDRVAPGYSGSETVSSMEQVNRMYFDLIRACIAEFLGTAIFIFNGTNSILLFCL